MFFCLVSVMNQSFPRYDVQTDKEKQPVSSAVRACWHLAAQLRSGMGSSRDLWFHYGAIPLSKAAQEILTTPRKHHENC